TYRLLIVKELWLPPRILYYLAALCESFCSSAAEKRDYAVFRDLRQLLFFFSASGVIETPSSTT
ncbi:hypothetical protein, partial [Massilia sp.]|uniref:hypothetical protein n=1 Tax=Massilia sp. TaxID=1882437 RepID=UPI0028B12C1F